MKRKAPGSILFTTITSIAQAADKAGYGMTSARVAALLPVVIGLISIILGVIALRSSRRNTPRKRATPFTVGLGLLSVVLSMLHLIRFTGAIGTGSGKLGALVAVVLGAVGIILGLLARSGSRR